MRGKVLFILASVLISASLPTQALAQTDDEEEGIVSQANPLDDPADWRQATRLRPGQGWRFGGQALMAPVWFFAGILTHESSHAVMGMACGFRVDRFYPYPVIVPVQRDERSEPVDTFYLGFTIFEPRPVSEVRDWQVAMTAIAPFLTDTLLFTVGDTLLTHVIDPRSAGAPFALVGLMMTPLADFIIGLFTLNEGGDLRQFSDAAGIPVGVSAGIGWSMAIVGLWRVAYQFRRIFMEPRSERERNGRRVSAAPLLGSDFGGFGLSGSF